jgi:hypothetical protein
MAIGVPSEGLQYLFELQKKHEEEFKSQNVWTKNARPPYLQTSYLLQLIVCFAASKKAMGASTGNHKTVSKIQWIVTSSSIFVHFDQSKKAMHAIMGTLQNCHKFSG